MQQHPRHTGRPSCDGVLITDGPQYCTWKHPFTARNAAALTGHPFANGPRIGANPGKALGGYTGHDGHPIIKCNYAQASPFLTVREAALDTPLLKHPATHCVKVYFYSVDWF